MGIRKNLFTILFGTLIAWLGTPVSGMSEIVRATCPPLLKMISSSPGHGATDVPVDLTITMTWDKATLENLSDSIRDLKPVFESINIAGGRYGMGTLLTTEWGIGGKVTWDDNRELITPEAPLEPGTQYRVWTYLYMTIRNEKIENCPGVGGEILFKTSGLPPGDGKPIRDFDLSTLYYGDAFGKATIRGPMTNLNLPLRVITIKDKTRGPVNVVVYRGTPVLRKGEIVSLEGLRIGDAMEITMTGGRVTMVVLLDVEQ